jgi:hypothetical protein
VDVHPNGPRYTSPRAIRRQCSDIEASSEREACAIAERQPGFPRRRQEQAGGEGQVVIKWDPFDRERIEHQPNIGFRRPVARKMSDDLAEINRRHRRVRENGSDLIAASLSQQEGQ